MKAKLSDVVNRINGNVDRFTTELEYYVGGEHFDSSELTISRYGHLKPNVEILGFKFHFAFQERDVLFMARNPHLRKAGMVTCSGLCSDASYILRSKDEGVITQEFIAIQLQTDHFWEYCESHKVGSVNFAINYRTLAAYEFELPPIEIQKEISNKVWAAYRLKEAYKRLLAATDEMVKSQFIEMFDSVESFSALENVVSDTFPGEWGNEPTSSNAIKVIRTTNFTNEGRLDLSEVVTREIDSKKVSRKKLKKGDTILERSGGTKDNPVGRVVLFDEDGDYLFNNFTQVLRPKENVNPVYLFYSLYNSYNLNKAAMRAMASQTTGIQNLSMSDYMAKQIKLPSKKLQDKFEAIYRQADKSKFELKKAIEAIDQVIKSLING